MTFREAMREPITVQSLATLAIGLFMGQASILVPLWLMGKLGA